MVEIIEFKGTLVKKERLAPDIVLLSFKLDEEFSFKAGQYVMVKVNDGDSSKLKAYSVFSPPSQKDTIDLCIKIIEGGFASEVFDKVEEETEFEMKGPFGRFFFDENNTSTVQFFICAGTGIAPLHSMLVECLHKYPDKKFKLLFGARTRKDLVYHEQFLELEKSNDNFEYLPTITREEWDGRQGRVQQHLEGDFSDTTFYICGLKEMVLTTKGLLIEKGVDPENIKFERYS
ncbi:hypothetical protein HQ533_04810 [Candidatus Woesearchaeota archaeon]|nr:hypothetical protein [Candidatus Woesearchaeota archaeon]